MIGSLAKLGVQVPGGFATTAHAYREFLAQGSLAAHIRADSSISTSMTSTSFAASSARIRQWILATPAGGLSTRQMLSRSLRQLSQRRPQARGRGALVSDCRPARGLLRRPAGDLPQHARQSDA